MSKIVLGDVQIRQASAAITTMVREANRKGGYKDVLAKLQDKEAGLSSHIYGLAKTASKMGRGKSDTILEWFLEMARSAEKYLKDNAMKELGHEIENVKDELPCWPVFKSEIKRAITVGADPGNYDSLNALKEARKAIEAQRDKRERDEKQNEAGAEGEGAGTTGGTASSTVQLVPTLAATLTVMQKRIKGMTDEQQELFAAKLGELLADFAEQETAEETPEVQEGAATEAAHDDQRQSA